MLTHNRNFIIFGSFHLQLFAESFLDLAIAESGHFSFQLFNIFIQYYDAFQLYFLIFILSYFRFLILRFSNDLQLRFLEYSIYNYRNHISCDLLGLLKLRLSYTSYGL